MGGGDEREPIYPKTVKKTGAHLSKWNPSLTVSDGMHFLLEWRMDEAGRIPESEIGFTQSRPQDNDLNASS